MAIGNLPQAGRVPSAITTPLVIVSAIFPVLSALAILLRFYAHRKSGQRYHADDAWVVVAWVSTLVISVLVWVFTSLSGIDYYRIDALKGTEYSLELIFLSSALIQVPLSTVKISILLFYNRIFQSRKFQACVWVAIGVVSVWGVVFLVFVITQVDPISQSWTGGRLRYDSSALGLAQIGTSVGLDLVVLAFPLPMIYRLQMAPLRKLSISLIFWLGAFCVIAAVLRLVFLEQSIHAVIQSQSNVFVQSKQFIFLILEPNCSIIAACLPCYGPLIGAGRGPESLLRSVWPIFSLRSNPDPKNSLTVPRGEGRRSASDSQSGSQVELHMDELSKMVQRDVRCVADNTDPEANPAPNFCRSGIYVTNGVSVQRE
ncbi:hypothetical protein O1611_g588 [Lasiodiplodia mahajangana]|uniref:Uncharacterized protein n=1 Tax=Lasiodiplodia mahajangana TaxID=1108764 RepID=A0ACC2JZX1_9PEZI|nr:hypothetical protein O1611_g588 [Lasiodiplodia mahajangana]